MNLTKYVGEQKRKSIELRKLQDEQYKKYIFLKKLNSVKKMVE